MRNYEQRSQRVCKKNVSKESAPTDIAVDIQLDVIIASPHDSVHAAGEILEEKPEAQESNPEVPFVPNEAS